MFALWFTAIIVSGAVALLLGPVAGLIALTVIAGFLLWKAQTTSWFD